MKSMLGAEASMATFLDYRNVAGQYNDEFIKYCGAVKLSEDSEKVIVVAKKSNTDEVASILAQFHRGKPVDIRECDDEDFAEFIGSVVEKSGRGGKEFKDKGEIKFRLEETSDSSVVNIINSIFIEAVRNNATDIHIEPSGGEVRIRFRVDGVLRTMRTLDAGVFPNLAGRIKVMADLNIMETRLPQDGHIQVNIGGKKLDIRCSSVPVQGGESIVLRLFDNSEKIPSLEELGFSENDAEMLKMTMKYPYGLVLFTGPTGSGKSTTMHSLLSLLNSDEKKIIAIEDPVERKVEGISQIQTAEEIGLTFEGILRRILRQDPDVIMIGEIRDGETAELAVRAAMTGHLLLATLHANNGEEAALRLENMGADPFLVRSVLKMCVSQRLVRKVCKDCAEEVSVPQQYEEHMRGRKGKAKILLGKGCRSCGGSGYKGRTVVSAMYCPLDGSSTSLRLNGLDKVFSGITSFSELEREGVI